MKTIAGAILIVAASVFYHARTELADKKIGYDERMEMIRICQIGAVVTGAAGLLMISTELFIPGANARSARHLNPEAPKKPVEG